MLITDKKELEKYSSNNRIWQGIPSIEVTEKGRIFITFYSGGTKEEVGNFSMVIFSDNGVDFSEPIAVAYKENNRCYDPCLWIDPCGRLWFTWAESPERYAVYGAICEDPDAESLVWSEPFEIGGEVMMNKPTVLNTGEWLFPAAVWTERMFDVIGIKASPEKDRRAFAYKSVDNGKSFQKLGGVDMPKRSFDEHMILELNDGRLAMYVRTEYGIGVAYSYDRGKNWTRGENSKIPGPCSRFFIRRLKSGRILLVNHYNFKGRNNLTALLSEDDGATWSHRLLLDGRSSVSYPDAVEADDGYIYITYDRERGCFKRSLDTAYADAREILYAKITEADIVAGELVDSGSRLAVVASKLGKYAYENKNPYDELGRYSAAELAKYLSGLQGEEILSALFDRFNINCINMHKIDSDKLDSIISELDGGAEKEKILLRIIRLMESATETDTKTLPIIERIKNEIKNNISDDISVSDIAEKIGISRYYMCHVFKKITGITVTDYKNELKLTKAKDLLIHTDSKIADIAYACGFGSASYFSKIFCESEGILPSQYREMLGGAVKK
jgi:AraC-like DNA-binding protein